MIKECVEGQNEVSNVETVFHKLKLKVSLLTFNDLEKVLPNYVIVNEADYFHKALLSFPQLN